MATTDWKGRALSADDAVWIVKSGMNVFVHGAAATPTPLIEALARREDLRGVNLFHMHTSGPAPFADPEMEGRFFSVSLFTGPRRARRSRTGAPTSCRSSSRTSLRSSRRVASRSTSRSCSSRPPTRTATARSAPRWTRRARRVSRPATSIAEINERMPRTHGNTAVHIDRVTAFIHTDRPLPSTSGRDRRRWKRRSASSSPTSSRTARRSRWASAPSPTRCSRAARWTSTTSACTPRCSPTGRSTSSRRRRSPTGSRRSTPGASSPASSIGTQRLYDFVDDNPLVEFHPCDRTNDTAIIRRNDEGGGDQLGDRGRPHRPGVRRLDRPPHLLRHRRADGLHPRRRALARRQADHRAPVDGREGQGVAHRPRRSSPAPAWSPRAATCTGS